MPSTIEIIYNRGNLFLNFGDVEASDPPSISTGPLFINDFTNPLDLLRLKQVMRDEGVHFSFKSKELDYLVSIQLVSLFSRNLVESLLRKEVKIRRFQRCRRRNT